MKTIKIAVSILALAALSACSSSDDSAPANEVATALTTVNTKLQAVSDMVGGTSSSFMPRALSPRASSLNGVWETADGVSGLFNGDGTTLKQWMIDEFDENFVNSNDAKVTFAGRIANGLDILCFMAQAGLPTDSTNLPTEGDHTLTLTAAMETACNSDVGDMVGEDISLTVTATTNTTNYDRLLSFELPGATECPFIYYARVNASAINLATSEDQTCDGRDHGSRTVFLHNKSTNVTRFHYISKAYGDFPSGFEVYNGYLDESADEAYIVGFYGSDEEGTAPLDGGITYTVVGKPLAGGTVAMSVRSEDNDIADDTYQGCVDPNTMAVETDNTLVCTLTGSDADAAHTNVVLDLYNDHATLEALYGIGETTTVGFTDESDIFN